MPVVLFASTSSGRGSRISEGLLSRALAAEQGQPLGIRYVRGDVAAAVDLEDASVDLVVCGFGLSDVDDLDGALATIARVLTPGGRFVLSILHPCFPGAMGVSGSWPSDGRYYDERRWYADGEGSTLRAQVGATHRMLSTYLGVLLRHGLVLDSIVEPAPEQEWARSWPDAARHPLYLVLGCTRR